MIFYKRITICNLFAYYGIQSVEFGKDENKPLYLIYGNNGFGKTSFIRSMKLLFLGSGLDKGEVPPIISSFVDKNRGKFTPKMFLTGSSGQNKWQGALNKKAYSENKNEFFVELVLEENGNEIIIKRSWNILYDLTETFTFSKNGEIFRDNEAKEMCEMLLPSQFVEFFIFDGEEIAPMADDISTELKEKIQNMLNISVLDVLTKQAVKYTKDLNTQNIKNDEDRNKYADLQSNIESAKRHKITKQTELENSKNDIKDLENELEIKSTKRDKLISNESGELAKIQSEIKATQANIEEAKNIIKSNQEEILFIGLEEIMAEICKKLADISSVSNLSQEELEKLCVFSAEYLHENHYKDISSATLGIQLKDTFDKFLKSSKQDKIFGSINGLAKLEPIYNGTKINQKLFSDAVLKYKENSNVLNALQKKQDDAISNTNAQDEKNAIEAQIKELQDQISNKKNEISSIEQALNDLDKNIAQNENEISHLEDTIKRDDRINEKIKIARILIDNIEKYKKDRVALITNELKNKILSYYKKLITNDNVCSVEINDFALSLKDDKNEEIAVKNQSAGQKQALAISIFWALSELSERTLPLIIDTPLGRIDGTIRSNIIQNYYFNASKQIIILPTDTEFGRNEYNIAKDKIASLYQINNDETRAQAYIKNCDINEILGE